MLPALYNYASQTNLLYCSYMTTDMEGTQLADIWNNAIREDWMGLGTIDLAKAVSFQRKRTNVLHFSTLFYITTAVKRPFFFLTEQGVRGRGEGRPTAARGDGPAQSF